MCVHRSIEELLGHFRTICCLISTAIFPGRARSSAPEPRARICKRLRSPGIDSSFFPLYGRQSLPIAASGKGGRGRSRVRRQEKLLVSSDIHIFHFWTQLYKLKNSFLCKVHIDLCLKFNGHQRCNCLQTQVGIQTFFLNPQIRKSSNSWAHSDIANPQIFRSVNPQIATNYCTTLYQNSFF
jgi:hypothetical protein